MLKYIIDLTEYKLSTCQDEKPSFTCSSATPTRSMTTGVSCRSVAPAMVFVVGSLVKFSLKIKQRFERDANSLQANSSKPRANSFCYKSGPKGQSRPKNQIAMAPSLRRSQEF